jgi:hypothetical protein
MLTLCRDPPLQVVVVMVSRAFFKNADCVDQLKRAIAQGKPIIPLVLEPVEMISHMVDGFEQEIKVRAPRTAMRCRVYAIACTRDSS